MAKTLQKAPLPDPLRACFPSYIFLSSGSLSAVLRRHFNSTSALKRGRLYLNIREAAGRLYVGNAMYESQSGPRTLPASVLIVAVIFGLNSLWHLFAKAVPAFIADEPEALSQGVAFLFSAALVLGLITLRPWARTWALIIATAGALIPAVLLGLLQHPEFAARFYTELHAGDVIRVLVVIGLLSALSVIMLKTSSAKRAFGCS
jgi:hypothetical protein